MCLHFTSYPFGVSLRTLQNIHVFFFLIICCKQHVFFFRLHKKMYSRHHKMKKGLVLMMKFYKNIFFKLIGDMIVVNEIYNVDISH